MKGEREGGREGEREGGREGTLEVGSRGFLNLQGFMALIPILARTTHRVTCNSLKTICRVAILESHKIWTARNVTT